MRIGQPGEKFQLHAYELEVKQLFNTATDSLKKITGFMYYSPNDRGIAKTALKELFENYYKTNSLDINSTGIVVECFDPEYEYFMAVALTFLDPFKIESFLNYHKQKYILNEEFEGLVEFRVYDIMDLMFMLKNEDRRERIMKWVNESRKAESKKRKKKVTWVKEKPLTWNKNYMPALKRLSKRLWKEKFTRLTADFEKAFTEGKEIVWKKDSEHLCYLLYKLRSHEPALFSATKGKGHYKDATNLFICNSRKITNPKYIPNTVHKFQIRKTGKSIPERNSIDLMIKGSLQQL